MTPKQTPSALWFSQQSSLGIWDAPEVLDALEKALKEKSELVKRFPATEDWQLGYLDIFCATPEHCDKLRKLHAEIRGAV